MFKSSFHLTLNLSSRRPRKILLRLRVKPRLVAIGDELAIHPLVKLVFRALLRLSLRNAECFKLRLVKWIRQIIEQVLRPSSLSLAHRVGILVQQICEKLRFAPKVVIHQPLHQLAYRLRPSLVIQHPEQATRLPRRHDGTLRNVPENIVVS